MLVQSVFASAEALNLLQSAFTSNSVGASGSVEAPRAPITDLFHIMQARALKAQVTVRTKIDTVSIDVEDGDNLPLAKQPRLSEHMVLEEDLEEDIYSSASRWQASEELSAFIETFRTQLQPFERKAICRNIQLPTPQMASSASLLPAATQPTTLPTVNFPAPFVYILSQNTAGHARAHGNPPSCSSVLPQNQPARIPVQPPLLPLPLPATQFPVLPVPVAGGESLQSSYYLKRKQEKELTTGIK